MSEILTITLNPTIDISGDAQTVRPTRKTRMTGMKHDPGGGGINVARVITSLGGKAEAVFLAGGEMGDLLDRLLAEEGIQRRRVGIAGLTRVGFMVHETVTGLEYRFIPPGPQVLPSEVEPCFDAVASHGGRYVVASGSLPVGVPTDTYARMAKIAADRGARFVLDCSGPALHETLDQGGVFLVKPSFGELETLAGRKLDEGGIREMAAGLVSRGAAEFVAVTMGADGALLAHSGGITRLPAIHVRVRSAVGAGDSFTAAMVWALSEGKAPEVAFRFGLAAGAAAAMTPGTELCRHSDVYKLFHTGRVT